MALESALTLAAHQFLNKPKFHDQSRSSAEKKDFFICKEYV